MLRETFVATGQAFVQLAPALKRIFIAAPLAGTAIFYGYVLLVRLYVGDWPRPYDPDPKIDALLPFYYLTAVAVPLTVATLFLAPALLQGRSWRSVLLAVFAWSVFVLAVWRDPLGFGVWFMD